MALGKFQENPPTKDLHWHLDRKHCGFPAFAKAETGAQAEMADYAVNGHLEDNDDSLYSSPVYSENLVTTFEDGQDLLEQELFRGYLISSVCFLLNIS